MINRKNIFRLLFSLMGLIALILIINIIWFKPVFIKVFFYKELITGLQNEPQTATKVKVPYFYGKYKDQLNDQSLEQLLNYQQHILESKKTLSKYSDSWLSEKNLLSKKIISWHLEKETEGFPYSEHKYFLNPYNGEQNSLPSYLDTYHYIEKESDVEAYLIRLSAFGLHFGNILERLELANRKGINPPRFIIENTVREMEDFIAMPADKNMLYNSFERKLNKCDNIEDKEKWLDKVRNEINLSVYPVYTRLINYYNELAQNMGDEEGVWKLPEGNLYYNYLLKHHTTLDIDPDSVHQIGIRESNRIKKELIAAFDKIGINSDQRTVGKTLHQIAIDTSFILGNSIEGRHKCLATYDSLILLAREKCENLFESFPQSKLLVKRVPEFKQEGASTAYYEVPSMDGNGEGSFYVRLDVLDDEPTFDMPTLAFHEGIPGHHFQLSYFLEKKSIPIFRKRFINNAYIEGWALYAENLMYEQGIYKDDPYGNIGRLKAELVRACRLVADSGIHSKKWNKQTAILYLISNTGLSRQASENEVDRYICDPGQATSYMIGYLKFKELKNKAKAQLGSQFDIKEFHSTLLDQGIVPLNILEELVNEYISKKQSQSS